MKKLMMACVAACAAVVALAGDQEAIAALIAAASEDAVIQLEAKTYLFDATLNVNKKVTLKGAGRGKTILDGGGVASVLKVSKAATVEDLTVSNGYNAASLNGAGIVVSSADVTLSNVCVTCCRNEYAPSQNEQTVCGGGIYSGSSRLRIVDCLVTSCKAYNGSTGLKSRAFGGGIYTTGANSLVSGTTVCLCRAAVNCGSPCGGGAYVSGAGTRLENAVVDGNEITNLTSTADFVMAKGAGLYLDGGAVASNLLVCGNVCRGRGAGAYLNGSATAIYDSTFTNNAVVGTFHNNALGSGGALSGDGGLAERCIMRFNSSSQGGSAYGCDSKRQEMLNACTLRYCLIEHNDGIPVRIGGSRKTLDHCVIRDNGGDAITFVNEGNGDAKRCLGNVVSHCVIDGNAGRCASASSMDTCMGYSNVVRNCLFRDNTASAADIFQLRLYVKTDVQANIGYTFLLENNTVVGNSAAGGSTVDRWSPLKTSEKPPVLIRNCIFANNTGVSRDLGDYSDAQGRDQMAATCFQRATNVQLDESSPTGYINGCKVVPEVADVKFVNVDAGDCRVRGVSPCARAGVAQPWMAEACDLGSGVYTITKSADWGVKIDFGKTKPRISDAGIVDMGACSCFTPGLMILLY